MERKVEPTSVASTLSRRSRANRADSRRGSAIRGRVSQLGLGACNETRVSAAGQSHAGDPSRALHRPQGNGLAAWRAFTRLTVKLCRT
jgi:hypothetical protein